MIMSIVFQARYWTFKNHLNYVVKFW